MTGYKNGLAHCAKFTNDVHDGRSSKRVTTLKGFIENDEVGIIDQCMSNLHPLSHSFAVLANLFVDNI